MFRQLLLLIEYYQLSIKKSLTEEEAERFADLMALTEKAKSLALIASKIDRLTYQKLKTNQSVQKNETAEDINQKQNIEHSTLGQEYHNLSQKRSLTEEEAERFADLMALAEQDKSLAEEADQSDIVCYQELGIIASQPALPENSLEEINFESIECLNHKSEIRLGTTDKSVLPAQAVSVQEQAHSTSLPFQLVYNREYPTFESFQVFLQACLKDSNLDHLHDALEIMEEAYGLYFDTGEASESVIIQLAWIKTSCMEIIQRLKQTENRRHFNHAVQALFDSNNPGSINFCASIARMLRQYRLSGTYEPKEIIAEAYARGVIKIEEGEFIQIPLAWLRRTCLNVIRDFQRKQTKIDKSKLDGDVYSPGGVVIEQLLWQEELTAIRVAFEQLNAEEQAILHARIFQNLSWQEIIENKRFSGQDGIPLKLGTARQRGARALQKLRHHYEQLREELAVKPENKLQ